MFEIRTIGCLICNLFIIYSSGDIKEIDMTRKTVNAGITMPISFLEQIDLVRGDICRSRFVFRAVEKYLNDKEWNGKNYG